VSPDTGVVFIVVGVVATLLAQLLGLTWLGAILVGIAVALAVTFAWIRLGGNERRRAS
jgi:hypothetical protein